MMLIKETYKWIATKIVQIVLVIVDMTMMTKKKIIKRTIGEL